MEIIREKISPRLRNYHIIHNTENVNPKTYSAHILLLEYYKEHDISFEYDNDWRYYFIVRRHYLRKVAKRDSEGKRYWTCPYCGEKITKMQDRNTKKRQKDCVTVDHIIPQSDPNCDKLNTKNMTPSCYKCNIEKKDKPLEVFLETRSNK